MSTNGCIGIQNSDGTITSIYSHWDNHIETNGKILLEHYQDEFKIRTLIEMGSISSLAESIECPQGHSFDNKIKGYTTFYHRDRKESWNTVKPITHGSYTQFTQVFKEYNYLYKDGQWFVAKDNTIMVPLINAKD